MPRPHPTKIERKLDSDMLVVRPYAVGIMTIGGIATTVIGLTILLVESVAVMGVVVTSVTLFTTQVVGYLLILAKQVESVHRMNSRLDSLLESTGLTEYIAGQAQGRADTMRELESPNREEAT